MPGATQPSSPPARDRLGPSLPALLRERLGIAERTTRIAVLVLALALVGGAILFVRLSAEPQLVHRGDPVFNVLYDDGLVRPAEPRAGELIRMGARRGDLRVVLVARRFALPPYEGNPARGLLPAWTERRKAQQREALPAFTMGDEARASLNGAPGYELAYASREGDRRTRWRDTYVLPDEPGARAGVWLTLTIEESPGRRTRPQRKRVRAVKSALRSFSFGTERSR